MTYSLSSAPHTTQPGARPEVTGWASPFDRALRVSTIVLLVWLPLPVGSNRDWSIALFVCLISLVFFGWTTRALYTGRNFSALRRSAPMLALLVVAQVWVALQWLLSLSTDIGTTFQQLMLGIGYSMLFILVIDLFQTKGQLMLLLGALTVSGTLQAFFGSYMTLSGTEWLLFGPKEHYLDVVTGTFVNRNHMAGYMEMTLSCGIGLMMAMRGGQPLRWKSFFELLLGPKTRVRLALIIMVIALVMTHSRMGNLAFFGSLFLVGGIFTFLHKKHRTRNALILLSLLLIDLLVISQYFGLDELKDRLVSTRLDDQVVAGEVVKRQNIDRDEVFVYGLDQFRERPFAGFGAGTFETSFQKYAGPDLHLTFDHAHNDYLEFAIELGVIGIIPLALFVIACIYRGTVALRDSSSLQRSGIGLGATMGILAIMFHSATDFNLQIPANAATFVVLCAIACQAGSLRPGGDNAIKSGSRRHIPRSVG